MPRIAATVHDKAGPRFDTLNGRSRAWSRTSAVRRPGGPCPHPLPVKRAIRSPAGAAGPLPPDRAGPGSRQQRPSVGDAVRRRDPSVALAVAADVAEPREGDMRRPDPVALLGGVLEDLLPPGGRGRGVD